MKRHKTVDDFALVTATRLAAPLKTAHELALDAHATTAGLNAAAAASEANKTWEATATLQADAQHALLVALRNEAALASERAHEMELQKHKVELESMVESRDLEVQASERREEQSVLLMHGAVKAAEAGGVNRGS